LRQIVLYSHYNILTEAFSYSNSSEKVVNVTDMLTVYRRATLYTYTLSQSHIVNIALTNALSLH